MNAMGSFVCSGVKEKHGTSFFEETESLAGSVKILLGKFL